MQGQQNIKKVLGQWDPYNFENYLNCCEVRKVDDDEEEEEEDDDDDDDDDDQKSSSLTDLTDISIPHPS